MKIGIDARLISQTGVGVYVYNLLHHIDRIAPEEWQFLIYARKEDTDLLPRSGRMTVRHAPYRWHSIAEQTSYMQLLNADDPDLMHFTYFSYPILYRKPFVSTIHDLTPILFKTGKASTKSTLEYYPKYFAMKKVISSSVRNARAVIVPSRAVKNQIIRMYGIKASDRIFVTHEGVNERLLKAYENRSLANVFPAPFLLYIGNFYPHKNIAQLLEAVRGLKVPIPLILVGPDDYFSADIRKKVRELGLRERVVFYHNPTLNDLIYFYRNARALVHPSLSEGFGLTLIEARHFGCPVIASDIPVFHETMGNEFTPFDPSDPYSIRTSIESVLKSQKKRSKSDDDRFSFRKMTSETISVYRKVIANSV